MKRTIYRDSSTGRFVKSSTWKRSKAQGGSRYVRQRITIAKRAPAREEEVPREDEEIEEIGGGFDSP